MGQAVSVFIMDVGHSSEKGNWNEVTEYLQEWETIIDSWCKNVVSAKVSHRRGDEILFVAQHQVTAFVIASAIAAHWKMTAQEPYFGLSHGFIEEKVDTLDIEIWNHPLIKQARQQSERIKVMRKRNTNMLFSDIAATHASIESSEMLNLLSRTLWVLRRKQSDNQRLVCSLFSVYKEQRKVAEILHKTPSTVSIHFNSGESSLILQLILAVQKLLCREEAVRHHDSDALLLFTQWLNAAISAFLMKHIDRFYPELAARTNQERKKK